MLPYRLPLRSLSSLSASLPLSNLHDLSPTHIVGSLNESVRTNLLANPVSFVPARYPSLSQDTTCACLQLLTALLNSLPISILDPSATASQRTLNDDESDHEAPPAHGITVPRLALDSRTLKRLNPLPEPSFITSLLGLIKYIPPFKYSSSPFYWRSTRHGQPGRIKY